MDFPGIGQNIYVRLSNRGLYTVADLYARAPKELRALWGNLFGEKIYYLIRGYEMAEEPTPPRRMIGHSHVLPPHLRPLMDARLVMRRLGLKCGSRLRRYEQSCGRLHLAARCENGMRFYHEYKCPEPLDDSHALLAILERLWQKIRHDFKAAKIDPKRVGIKKISISLTDLHEKDDFIQPDLFQQNEKGFKTKNKNQKLSQAMDALNKKYGRDTVILGAAPKDTKSFAGTKIAFTRIPDQEEFFE
jgi:DNA polymerase-4